jgi:hypothetical protein
MVPVISSVTAKTGSTVMQSAASASEKQTVCYRKTGSDREAVTWAKPPIPRSASDCLNSFLNESDQRSLKMVNKYWHGIAEYHTKKKLTAPPSDHPKRKSERHRRSAFVPVKPAKKCWAVVDLLLEFASNKQKRPLSPTLRRFITAGYISRKKATELDEESRKILNKPHIQKIIVAMVLTVDDVLRLKFAEIGRLGHPCLTWLICDKLLSVNFALMMTSDQIERLSHDCVQKYLLSGFLRVDDALRLNALQIQNLQSTDVQHYIDRRQISLTQLLAMNAYGRINLEHPMTRYVIGSGQCTLPTILHHSQHATIQYDLFYTAPTGKVEYLRRE